MLVILLLVGLLTGCATAHERHEAHAWRLVCEDAPYEAGMSIDPQAQRAMTALDLWKRSIEDINAECATR